MIFVTLPVSMKNRMLRFSAMLLVLWYCFSVIGFDVHTCKASGRSFIATVVSGLSCADIHPSHTCDHDLCHSHDGCCGHEEHQDETSLKSESCCSDDYHVLALTGTVSEKDHLQQLDMMPVCLSSADADGAFSIFTGYGYSDRHVPDSVPIVSGDAQSLLNIWRI